MPPLRKLRAFQVSKDILWFTAPSLNQSHFKHLLLVQLSIKHTRLKCIGNRLLKELAPLIPLYLSYIAVQ